MSCQRNIIYYVSLHKTIQSLLPVIQLYQHHDFKWLWEPAYSQIQGTAREQGKIPSEVLTEIRDFLNMRCQIHGVSRNFKDDQSNNPQSQPSSWQTKTRIQLNWAFVGRVLFHHTVLFHVLSLLNPTLSLWITQTRKKSWKYTTASNFFIIRNTHTHTQILVTGYIDI